MTNNPIVIGGCPVCPPAQDAINSVPWPLQVSKTPLEVFPWYSFEEEQFQWSNLVKFHFWSQCKEARACSSHRLPTCYRWFVFLVMAVARLITATLHRPDVASLSWFIEKFFSLFTLSYCKTHHPTAQKRGCWEQISSTYWQQYDMQDMKCVPF